MRFSVWSDGSSPVYLNPTLPEIVELANSRVDTLRICEEPGQLALASGFGNTHTTVSRIAREHWGRRWMGYSHILFRSGNSWRWNINCESIVGTEFNRGLLEVEEITAQFAKDFVALVGQL